MSSRPRREAVKRSQQQLKEQKIDLQLSDDEEEDEVGSEDDFSSGSSEDYDPNKSASKATRGGEEESEDDDPVSEEEDEEEESFMTNMREKNRKSKGGNRSLVASLRRDAINKFRNKQANLNKSNSSQKLQEILRKAEFNRGKPRNNKSGDDEREKTPDFDCSGGVNLSDCSSDSDVEEAAVNKAGKVAASGTTTQSEASAGTMVDLKVIHDNLQEIKNAKEKLSNYKSSKKHQNAGSQKENVNIADLLALGEAAPSTSSSSSAAAVTTKLQKKASQKRALRTQGDDSDSDNWEDVEENDSSHHNHAAPKESVQIVLNEFGDSHVGKRQEKQVDVEAQMKRKINRRRKEIQEFQHKMELMCWIAHYSFVNKRLNDTNLINTALKMLPANSKQCYPKEKTDIDYFQQVTKWFKGMMSLKNTNMYCERLKKRPPLMMSLAIQMKFKAAICRRDYILIYITLLRALGIQCRMVQSVVCDPKICPKSVLLSVPTKKPDESSTKQTTASKSASKSSKNVKKAKQMEKIPQLDGVDDVPERKKPRKPIKIKGVSVCVAAESLSPKVSVALNSPNHVKKSISGSLAKALKVDAFSPRKTRSESREPRNGEIAAKDSKGKTSNGSLMENEKVGPRTSDDRPSTSAQALKRDAQKLSGIKQSEKVDRLKVASPISRRLRSKSSDSRQDDSSSLRVSESLSRKRTSSAKVEVDSKKIKLTDDTAKTASRKRAAPPPSDREASSSKSKKAKKVQVDNEEDAADSDDSSLKYFKTTTKPMVKQKPNNKLCVSTSAKIDRRILSSDDETEAAVDMGSVSPKKSKGIDIWVEVYSEKDEKWIAIDVFRNKIDCVKDVTAKATHPLVYVFAWNNDNSVKDVSARYCANLNTTVRKMRVERDYLSSILNAFPGTRTARDFKEDEELNQLQFAVPMPKSIAEFKNHPLYVLKRHLLKFQAIYPPEPPILGYLREEAIYPRDCVFLCHSRETWLKEARVVKLYEKPYKMVTTLKWNKQTNKIMKDVPLELFGIWQTKEYEPPTAENGLVPRNGYGNVELFKPQMLPHGTVHLQLPGLQKVCKKMGVDCAQAVVGFDSSGGWPFPVYDGFVVCKEFEEKVIDAWNREQEEIERREREKIDKRVYGNWKKLIKGLLIRERLKLKYNFDAKDK